MDCNTKSLDRLAFFGTTVGQLCTTFCLWLVWFYRFDHLACTCRDFSRFTNEPYVCENFIMCGKSILGSRHKSSRHGKHSFCAWKILPTEMKILPKCWKPTFCQTLKTVLGRYVDCWPIGDTHGQVVIQKNTTCLKTFGETQGIG